MLRNKQEKTLTVTVDELDLDAEQNPHAEPQQQIQAPQEEHGTRASG